jgi:hypothetical protein
MLCALTVRRLKPGTLEELRGGQRDSDYDERRSAADEFVDSVGTDGIFEVLEERSLG